LSERFADFCLLGEGLDFFLQMPGTPRIGSGLNYGVITDLAVPQSVRDFVLMLYGTLA
jgi:hypothetical protein